ncbi:MAG: hypothetical protein FWD66_01060 [Paludibacter sp.]|nr:hypothetical protein [Paludibacter sp.]
MLQQIKQILETVNCEYIVIYETDKMANVVIDDLTRTAKFVHIDEFRDGKMTMPKYRDGWNKILKMELYFCHFCQMQDTAEFREQKREQIENEIVRPFIDAYQNSGLFDEVAEWGLGYPPPQFDANEVGVLLRFDCSMINC